MRPHALKRRPPMGRYPELILGPVKWLEEADDQAETVKVWATNLAALPLTAAVGVIPWPQSVRDMPAAEGGIGSRWAMASLTLHGWGRVHVGGELDWDDNVTCLHSFAAPVGSAMQTVFGGGNNSPRELDWMDPTDRVALMLTRLQIAMLALGASAYLVNPEWWGGVCPLLDTWVIGWHLHQGTPYRHPSTGLTLTDLSSY